MGAMIRSTLNNNPHRIEHINVFSLIFQKPARGDFRFMLHEGSVNAKVFLDFLKRLMIGATRPVFVILDGHPIHKAAMIKTGNPPFLQRSQK